MLLIEVVSLFCPFVAKDAVIPLEIWIQGTRCLSWKIAYLFGHLDFAEDILHQTVIWRRFESVLEELHGV